jgi:tetratricopeptide (TPR) repeat protein
MSSAVVLGMASFWICSGQAEPRALELLAHGDFARAVPAARVLVEDSRTGCGPTSPQYVRAVNLELEALCTAGEGRSPRASELRQEVTDLAESKESSHLANQADSLRNFGCLLETDGALKDALGLYEQAAKAPEPSGVENPHLSVLASLDVARLATTLGDFERARTALEAAQKLTEEIPRWGGAHRAEIPLRLAKLELELGNYASARPLLEEALLHIRDWDPGHPTAAEIHHARGDFAWYMGKLEESRECYRAAISVATARLGPSHPQVADHKEDLAEVETYLSDLTATHDLLKDVLEIRLACLGPKHPSIGWARNGLGSTLVDLGEYGGGQALLNEALRALQESPEPRLHAVLVHNQARLAARLGDYSEALRLERLAGQIWSDLLGSRHPYVALSSDRLAEILLRQGRFAEARELLERVVELRRSDTSDYAHPERAWTLTTLADVLLAEGVLDRAEELAEESCRVWRETGAPEHPGHASALLVMGRARAARGRFADAEAVLQEALSIQRDVLGSGHPAVAATLAELAVVMLGQGQAEQALDFALEAERIGRDHLKLVLRRVPERLGLSYATVRPRGLDVILSMAARPGRPPNTVRVALDAVVRSRALALDEAAWRQRALASRSELAGEVAAVRAARRRLANLLIDGLWRRFPDSYRKTIDRAQRELEDAERALSRVSGPARSAQGVNSEGLESVVRDLEPGHALVAYARYMRVAEARARGQSQPSSVDGGARGEVPSYVAFVLRRGGSPAVVDLGPACDIESAAARWRKGLIAELTTASETRSRASGYAEAGDELRRLAWDLITRHVEGTSLVLIVPDGVLNLISFEALPSGDGRFVIEDVAGIHYLAAERDVTKLATPSQPGMGMVAIGGPAFGKRWESAAEPPPSAQEAVTAPDCWVYGTRRFVPLPGAFEEASTVIRIWNDRRLDAEEGIALTGRDATEGAVKRAAPGKRLLHFATHGFFLQDDCHLPGAEGVPGAFSGSPLLRSGLALAGANEGVATGIAGEDGILTAEEIATLDLQGTEWATLSACETGVGDVATGEGVVGLRRAFQVAGVRTIIMSLWPVEDAAAAEWMKVLYTARFEEGLSTAAAMKRARVNALARRRERGRSTNPFFWSSFVASGDWR